MHAQAVLVVVTSSCALNNIAYMVPAPAQVDTSVVPLLPSFA